MFALFLFDLAAYLMTVEIAGSIKVSMGVNEIDAVLFVNVYEVHDSERKGLSLGYYFSAASLCNA